MDQKGVLAGSMVLIGQMGLKAWSAGARQVGLARLVLMRMDPMQLLKVAAKWRQRSCLRTYWPRLAAGVATMWAGS